MRNLHIFRIPTFNSVLVKMSLKIDDKELKIKSNQIIEVPIESETVEITVGKMMWKKRLKLDFKDSEDKYLALSFKSKPNSLIDHFRKPAEYLKLTEVNSSEFNEAVEENETLNYVKASMANFIDAATIFLGAALCLLFFPRKATFIYFNLFAGVIGLSAILSVGIRRLSYSKAFTQRESLFRLAISASIALVIMLIITNFKALPLLLIAALGFWFLWSGTRNATYIN